MNDLLLTQWRIHQRPIHTIAREIQAAFEALPDLRFDDVKEGCRYHKCNSYAWQWGQYGEFVTVSRIKKRKLVLLHDKYAGKAIDCYRGSDPLFKPICQQVIDLMAVTQEHVNAALLSVPRDQVAPEVVRENLALFATDMPPCDPKRLSYLLCLEAGQLQTDLAEHEAEIVVIKWLLSHPEHVRQPGQPGVNLPK